MCQIDKVMNFFCAPFNPLAQEKGLYKWLGLQKARNGKTTWGKCSKR
jgi:hypothetical protein